MMKRLWVCGSQWQKCWMTALKKCVIELFCFVFLQITSRSRHLWRQDVYTVVLKGRTCSAAVLLHHYTTNSSLTDDTRQDGFVLLWIYTKFWPCCLTVTAEVKTNQTRRCFFILSVLCLADLLFPSALLVWCQRSAIRQRFSVFWPFSVKLRNGCAGKFQYFIMLWIFRLSISEYSTLLSMQWNVHALNTCT